MTAPLHIEEDQIAGAFERKTLLKLLHYFSRHRLLLFLSLLGIGSASVCELAIPQLIRFIIDTYITPTASLALETRRRGLAQAALLLLGIVAARSLFSAMHSYCSQVLGQYALRSFRLAIVNHILRLPIAFLDRTPLGRLLTRSTADISRLDDLFSTVLLQSARNIFMLVGIVALIFSLHLLLGFLVILILAALFVCVQLYGRFSRDTSREISRQSAVMHSLFQEHVAGITTLQLMNQDEYSRQKVGQVIDGEFHSQLRHVRILGVFQPLISFVCASSLAVALFWGGHDVLSQSITLGTLVAFLNYMEMLFNPVRDLSEKYSAFQRALASAERALLLLDEPQEESGKEPISTFERLEFRNVSFAYRNEEWVLRDVSFDIRRGQRIAFAGPTGSGKSSIFSLLVGLYQPQRGEILYNGKPLRSIDKSLLRDLFGVVTQEQSLFRGTVADNLAMGNPECHNEPPFGLAPSKDSMAFSGERSRVAMALSKSELHQLSHGERQLVALSRALARNPQVLLLDEATANIDSQTEALIEACLHDLATDRTFIVIAHRLTAIEETDVIYVLNQGCIVEHGSHAQLLQKKGLYAALHSLQRGQFRIPGSELNS